ncbi:ABC transporter ATP-binding protein [Kitasatospora sp. NPDC059146]|uniref:ABC transporter ATP-binding protein n=1 Tax=unclassified Kitasatospora TaxID=2633591 RepID=UPI00369B394C
MAESRTDAGVPVLAVSGLECRVSSAFALRGVDFSVAAGEGVAVIGTNGAGKTTLIRLLAGLLQPTAGQVRICGTPPRSWGRASRHLGYVQQAKELPDGVTVETYLRHQLRLRRADPGRYRELVGLAGLGQYVDQYVRRLSGGSQRKLHIISAVAHRPDLLILDEPTTGLDPTAQETVLDLLRGLKAEGTGVLFASHHREELVALADSVVMLHQGQQVKEASLAEVVLSGGRSSLTLHAFADSDVEQLRVWAAKSAAADGPAGAVRPVDGGVTVELSGGARPDALGELVARAHADGLALRSASYGSPTLAEVVRSIVEQVEGNGTQT